MIAARAFLVRHRLELSLALGTTLGGLGLGYYWHGDLKSWTPTVATVAPLLFTTAVLALLALAALGRRDSRSVARVRRLSCLVALLALLGPAAFLKVETLFAASEWRQQTPAAVVVDRIATDRDPDRVRAWARLLTLPVSDRDEVARQLAPLLVGDDAGARHSAALTLAVPLRRHTITVLIALAPELEVALRQGADGDAPLRAARAATFARDFVKDNAGAIRRALEPSHRAGLPNGAVRALMVTLAACPGLGHAYLDIYAKSEDPLLSAPARDIRSQLRLAH